MKYIFLIVLFAFHPSHKIISQVGLSSYEALSIPEDLKKNADAVYRLDEGVLDVTSPSKYTYTTHRIITLLNKDAAHHLHQAFYYNKFLEINNVVFKIYNGTGELIRTYQKKDFSTRAYTDRISLYTDDKIRYLEAASPGYPCTIDITCVIKVTGYIELPDWIEATPNEAVEHSSFTVKIASPLSIKYRALHTNTVPSIDSSAGTKIYLWTAKNILAIRSETDSYASYNLPRIEIVPATFEYDDYKGGLNSWQAFGAWNYQFYEDNKPFAKEDIQRIKGLVAHCKSDLEKLRTLYSYLEKTMRYVSIQLGIGGFKPFPVKYVNEKKYGDCKALTNYMRYMLKVVGINSYPALINAGYNKAPADLNFPSDPFNHVILCVPFENDSVWLECTSSNNEYGFLGSFTENKNALLLTEKGGVLVATPRSNYINNILSTKTIIALNEEGGSQVTADIFCTGDFWNLFYWIMNQPDDQKKNIFINYLHYKIPERFKIDMKPDSANGKLFNLTLSYDQQYEFKAGDKLFFKPRLSSISTEDIQPLTQRKFDYIFEFPYTKVDTTVYILPPGDTIGQLPPKKELMNEYALYTNEYLKNESNTIITVIASLTLKKRIVPPADYLQVADFFRNVNRIENEKFIVKKH